MSGLEGHKMKIMIVDDDAGARRLLQRHLDEFGTHVTANNGQEAVEAFKQAMDAVCQFLIGRYDINR